MVGVSRKIYFAFIAGSWDMRCAFHFCFHFGQQCEIPHSAREKERAIITAGHRSWIIINNITRS
jgi:1-acyl-sn-glycerol-3-phosphate acyltransferase